MTWNVCWSRAGTKLCRGVAFQELSLTHLAQRFATVFGLNDMFPGNGVQRCATGFEISFLLFGGCVKKVSPISSNMYINHAVLKRPLAQWVQVKSFNMCSLQLGIHNN